MSKKQNQMNFFEEFPSLDGSKPSENEISSNMQKYLPQQEEEDEQKYQQNYGNQNKYGGGSKYQRGGGQGNYQQNERKPYQNKKYDDYEGGGRGKNYEREEQGRGGGGYYKKQGGYDKQEQYQKSGDRYDKQPQKKYNQEEEDEQEERRRQQAYAKKFYPNEPSQKQSGGGYYNKGQGSSQGYRDKQDKYYQDQYYDYQYQGGGRQGRGRGRGYKQGGGYSNSGGYYGGQGSRRGQGRGYGYQNEQKGLSYYDKQEEYNKQEEYYEEYDDYSYKKNYNKQQQSGGHKEQYEEEYDEYEDYNKEYEKNKEKYQEEEEYYEQNDEQYNEEEDDQYNQYQQKTEMMYEAKKSQKSEPSNQEVSKASEDQNKQNTSDKSKQQQQETQKEYQEKSVEPAVKEQPKQEKQAETQQINKPAQQQQQYQEKQKQQEEKQTQQTQQPSIPNPAQSQIKKVEEKIVETKKYEEEKQPPQQQQKPQQQQQQPTDKGNNVKDEKQKFSDDLYNEGYYNDQDYGYEQEGYDENQNYYDDYYEEDKYTGGYNKKNETYQVLMVAEKPMIAKAIAESLCGPEGYKQSNRGMHKVHEYYGSIFGKKAHFKVTSVAGHVFTTDFPNEYKDWKKIDPQELFNVDTQKKEANPKSKVVMHLRNVARYCSYLVLWLDNDKEGENICFEVLDCCEKQMRKENFQQIYRAKFSSITKSDIQEAFNCIKDPPNENESNSVNARQIIDLKIGVAFSRFQTLYFTEKYDDLNQKIISFGPCQTPTLGFCVARHDEITNFKPKLIYKIIAKIENPDGGQASLETTSFLENEANQMKKEIELKRDCFCVKLDSADSTRSRPEALNTVNMLKVASSNLGLGPQQAMYIAESLYLNGYITYPRTESTSYPKKFDFQSVVSQLRLINIPQIAEYAYNLQKNQIQKPKQGVDAGDHPPITPTSKTPQKLSSDEQKLYEYITRHFLGTISRDAQFEKTQAVFQIGNHNFNLSGVKITSPGFTEIMNWVKIHGNLLPSFKKGERYSISSVVIANEYTQPPDYLTESDLIGLMEKYQIGTDASMSQHINNICVREYVKVVMPNRKLVPTELGQNLVHGYQQIDTELVAPELRAFIERSTDSIARGAKKTSEVLNEVINIFKQKYEKFTQNINKMDQYFGKTYDTVDEKIEKAHTLSKCGACNRFMKHLAKKGKLICENCKIEFDLPKNGHAKLMGDKYCPLDKYQIIAITISLQNFDYSYSVCPKCYNDEAIEEANEQKVTCNVCPQKDCEYSSISNGIGRCDACSDGDLIIDLLPYSNKFGVTCNNCANHYVVATKAYSVKKQAKVCDTCKRNHLKIAFHKEKVKEAAGGKQAATIQQQQQMEAFNDCVFCNKEYSTKFVTQEKPKYQGKQFTNNRGGRGGRGGGRRGGRRGGSGGNYRGGGRGGNRQQQNY